MAVCSWVLLNRNGLLGNEIRPCLLRLKVVSFTKQNRTTELPPDSQHFLHLTRWSEMLAPAVWFLSNI